MHIMLNILKNGINNIILSGLTYFIKKNLIIYKNLFLIFREYFWIFETNYKEEFISKLLENAKINY